METNMTPEPSITCVSCGESPHGAIPCWTSAYNRADVASKAGDDPEASRLRLVSIRHHSILERERATAK